MRADLRRNDGSSLLVLSDDAMRAFVSEEDAYRWLLPFAVEPDNIRILRRALADQLSPVFIARLDDHAVLRRVARIVARACVAVDLPRASWAMPADDPAEGDPEARPTALDLGELAEDEAVFEDTRPEPVLPPEFPRMARRQADYVRLRAHIMAMLLQLLRFVGEKLLPESAIGSALVAMANSYAVAVEDEAGDFGGRMAALARGGAAPTEPSAVARTIRREATQTADSVRGMARRAGDVISGLLLGPGVGPENGAVGRSIQDAAARQGRGLQAAANDAGAVLDQLAIDRGIAGSDGSEISPAIAEVARAQARIVERMADIGPEFERMLRLPLGWQGPERPDPAPGEPVPPIEARLRSTRIRITCTDDTEATGAVSLLPGTAVQLIVETVDAPAGSRVIFSVRLGDRGHLEDVFATVPAAGEPASPSSPSAEETEADAVEVAADWIVPALPVGAQVWLEARYLRGPALGASARIPVLPPFAFGDAGPVLGEIRRLASGAATASSTGPVSADTRASRFHAPRWVDPDDVQRPPPVLCAGRGEAVLLLVDARGLDDGARVTFTVHTVDGPIAELSGAVVSGRAQADWQVPPLPPGELTFVVRSPGARSARSGVLPIRAAFPFGDASTSPPPPPSLLAGVTGATIPPPHTADRPEARLHAPRWLDESDPSAVLMVLPAGGSQPVGLRVDTPGVPDGRSVVFRIRADGQETPLAELRAPVAGGKAEVIWTPEPAYPAGGLRFAVRLDAMDGPWVTSGPLSSLPAYDFGDGAGAPPPTRLQPAPDGPPVPEPEARDGSARLHHLRWIEPGDSLEAVYARPAGQPLRLALRVEAPGMADGAALVFAVTSTGGDDARYDPATVRDGVAQVLIERSEPAPGRLDARVWPAGREAESIPSTPLWIRPRFDAGDAGPPTPATSLRQPGPPPPPPVTVDGLDPRLHGLRWVDPGDPTSTIAGLERRGGARVGIRAEALGLPDGTPVSLRIDAVPLAEQPLVILRAQVTRGVVSQSWQLPADGIPRALKITATAAALSEPACGATLYLQPPFDFGA